MIFDVFENWSKYSWTCESFRLGFEFLEKMGKDVEDGKHVIDGDDVYCMIDTYETTPVEGHEFEAHRVYADIQYIMSGEESILWAPRKDLEVTKPYKPDIEFQALIPSPTELVLKKGCFCVFFPDDAHAPCIAHGAPSRVRKAVVKVRL